MSFRVCAFLVKPPRCALAPAAAFTSLMRRLAASGLPRGLASRADQPRLLLSFSCTHPDCSSSDEDRKTVKTISKLAYERGVVLVRCKCDKLHLIADRLGWFADGGTDIEQILKERGEEIGKLTSVVDVEENNGKQ